MRAVPGDALSAELSDTRCESEPRKTPVSGPSAKRLTGSGAPTACGASWGTSAELAPAGRCEVSAPECHCQNGPAVEAMSNSVA